VPRVTSNIDTDDFVRRYRSGETLHQLMAVFHIGHARARAILASYGIEPVRSGVRLRKLTEQQTSELVTRYLAGESTKQLGPAFGISSRVVSDYLRRAGVEARPRHQAVVDYMAGLTHEQRSAMVSASMRKRWQTATPEQRAQMLDPAHTATRGVPLTAEHRQRIVQAKERRSGSDSQYEEQVAQWLTERGVEFRQQVAIGDHCADFTVGPVAVEVTTGWARKKEWGPRFARYFDEGWHLYVIWHDTRVPLLPVVADDLVAWADLVQADPAAGSQHRVVWRSRKVLSSGGGDADYVASVLKSATPRGSWPLYDRSRHKAE
jgi:hypothetical protein